MVEVLCQILIIKRDSEVPTQLAGISNLVRYLLRQKSANILLKILLRFLEWTQIHPVVGTTHRTSSPPAASCGSRGTAGPTAPGAAPFAARGSNLPRHRPPAWQGMESGAPDPAGQQNLKVINVQGLTSAWSCGTSGPVAYVRNGWHLVWLRELTGWHALRGSLLWQVNLLKIRIEV